MVARIPRSSSPCNNTRAITPVQYRVILHGTGIGKYCCRNMNWIINIYTSEMIHHRGTSLSEQQTAGLLICHGTQQELPLSTVT